MGKASADVFPPDELPLCKPFVYITEGEEKDFQDHLLKVSWKN